MSKKHEAENLTQAVAMLESALQVVRSHLANPQEAKRHFQVVLAAHEQVKAQARLVTSTKPNHWAEDGEVDPFSDYFGKERAQLALGHMSDDQVAHMVFVHGNDYGGMLPHPKDIIAGKAHMPITYLTAAKERIRWLSRKLIEVTDKYSALLDKTSEPA